ncbi:hypothetical protein [Sinomonas flava]|uniref:hypothetical protein n=1 Tax=Sinomonas flava TaxID=496857 RepID=UPI0039A69A95
MWGPVPGEGLAFGAHYSLPQDELLNLFKVSTGDSWVARNWDSVSEWTAALAVHNIPMPFNALSSTQLFHSMGKEPKAK